MRSYIGLNLPGVRPTDRGCVFNDATASADWFKKPDNKTPLPLAQLNAAGYPAGDFAWQIFYKCPPAAYNGTYAIEIDGTVTGIAGLSSPLNVGPIVQSVDGKTRATITVNAVPPATASMTLRFTGVANVTKIRIWRGDPPADGQRRWHTVPLDLLKNANAGVIRGMEFLRINSGKLIVNPSDLTGIDAPTYCYSGPDDGHQTGCPPELLFYACNAARADCWQNIWIDATDETAAAVFAKARDTLRPDVFYWVELHNELWNAKFSFKRGHDLAQAKGKELAAAGELGFAGISDPNQLGWRYTAYRACKLIELARQVFGDQAYRVRGILAGQAYDNRPLDEGRKLLRERNAVPSDYFAGYAITHYFGAARGDVESTLIELPSDATAAVNHRDADQFFQACAEDGVRPLAYEAGTGFTGSAEFLSAVMRDSRMKDVNFAALQQWRNKAGGLWCKFTAWGDWGKSSYAATDDPTWQSPTLQAFAEYGPTWPYTDVPVKPDPRDAVIRDLTAKVAQAAAQLTQVSQERDAAKAEAAEKAQRIEAAKAALWR